jgi:hypothetical protein
VNSAGSPVDAKPSPRLAARGPSRLAALAVAALSGLVALGALGLSGWGFETDPAQQLLRDAPQLVVCGVAGAVCGASLAWALPRPPRTVVVLGAALGTMPAVVMATAYFTHRY